ncbi:MAG: HlyC/CorC family transporter, partial [Terracidiphilus sp.]
MTPLHITLFVVLFAIATLASYMQRVYSEFGRIMSREDQGNLDAWEERVEPHLGLSREHAALCASVLKQLSLGLISLGLGALLFIRPAHLGPPTAGEIAQSVLTVVLVVIFAYQLLPDLLFNRTRGLWAVRLLWPIRLLLWLVTPVTVFIRFFFSIAA